MSKQEDSIFVDEGESMVAVIGTNYIQNFLSGGPVEKSVGILTPKRFYYKGRNFSGAGKDMAHTTEEGVVSIEDVAFTSFNHTRHIGALIAGIAAAVIGVILFCASFDAWGADSMVLGYSSLAVLGLAICLIVKYFVARKTVFTVSFPGGSFGFDIRYYPIADIRDFQRQLHLMKDHIKENA